jgi:hypothetical protein
MYLFFLTLWRYILLAAHALAAPFERYRRLGGAVLLILGLPVFFAWQALNWLGLLLDEVFFRGYRRVEIRRPLFVVGPPRTGTTHLHHVLSASPETTTFRTWECLFGISVTGRYACLALGKLHRAIGSPLSRLGSLLGQRLVGRLDEIHPIRMDDPEEDFLALLPPLACFLVVVPLPRARWLWRLARFDRDVGPAERRALLSYYRRAIQRHLYVFGDDKTFLSKNASFAGMTQSLLEEFPDARIIATVRDPLQVVPSQLSSLRPALELCGFSTYPDYLREDFLHLLEHYFMNLVRTAASTPGRITFIENSELRYELIPSLERAFGELSIPLSDELRNAALELSDTTDAKASRHRYSLEEFGLDEASIRSRFAAVYTSFDFGRAKPAAGQEQQ